MRIPRLPHGWDLTTRQAIAAQRRLAKRVRLAAPEADIRIVAGLDAAFSADGRWCLAAVVLWDVEARSVIEQHAAAERVRFPYIPGLLSFREAPALLSALCKVRTLPDLLLCDGQGLAHPRRFGIACHLGVICRLPSLGCAKSRLIGEHKEPGRSRGSQAPLMDRGECVGAVLRTQDGVRPLYISVGHQLDLPAANRLVLACAIRYRLPEPTRLADRLVAAVKRGEFKPDSPQRSPSAPPADRSVAAPCS